MCTACWPMCLRTDIAQIAVPTETILRQSLKSNPRNRLAFELLLAHFLVAGQSETTGLSAAQPRVSPDGRFLVCCLADYGNFPIYQPSSDLYMLDVGARQSRRLEINSEAADTWHCWSSNGRWLVFSSKRRDGLFARP